MSSYTQLYVPFAISAVMHAQSHMINVVPANLSTAERTVGILLFFMWQAVAITAEDAAQWTWKKLGGSLEGSSVFRTTVGYAWVAFSFWYSIPWAADVLLRMRMGEYMMVPVSLVGKYLQEFVPVPR